MSETKYDLCLVDPSNNCKDCSIADHLKCHFNRKYLARFIAMFFIFAIPSIYGIYTAGFGWWIIGWITFMGFFFNVWEIKILCTHCPYYAEDEKTLKCNANYGSLKLWKYNPKPMTIWEKTQLLIGFAILVGYPFPFMVIGAQWFIAVISLLGAILFFTYLITKDCTKCVNFSCPLNRVSKEVIDEFLKKNPIMAEAWRGEGWVLEDSRLN